LRRGRKNGSSIALLSLFAVIIGAVLYGYNAEMFEREAPVISMKNNGYWNLKNSLDISIDDTTGLKAYKVILIGSSEETLLYNEQFLTPKQSVNIKVEPPKSAYTMKENDIKIVVEAVDTSKWNFFKGNIARSEFKLKIDKKRPALNTVANSYKISKGGAALVVFKAEDENLKDIVCVKDFISQVKGYGAKIAIDDFGTGYSSLSYLKNFPFDKLKIDQSFVRSLPNDTQDIGIVRSIIGIANALNLNVIAEGVETKDNLDFLNYEGCSLIQGYYYSKPLPLDGYIKFIECFEK